MQQMKIESYSFGRMVVDGLTFKKDLIIYSNHVEANWWRAEGHRLQLDDLKQHLENAQARVLVIGTGKLGMMQVPEELQRKLEDMNIRLVIEKTDQAVACFNQLGDTEGLVGAFHLTC